MDDTGASNSCVEDEIMVLQSIYEDKIKIERDLDNKVKEVGICLYPATADDTSSQYLKLELVFTIPDQYPEEHLKFTFKSSRGLSDEHLNKLKQQMMDLIDSHDEDVNLFDLIELAKESLTLNNIPCDPCPVCLLSFQADDDFLKSPCFHHFHDHCLLQYYNHYHSNIEYFQTSTNPIDGPPKKKSEVPPGQVPCPICRELVEVDIDALQKAKEPETQELSVENLEEYKRNVKQMNEIYERQLKVGGIINLDAEKKKHLLSTIEQKAKSEALIAKSKQDAQTKVVGTNSSNSDDRKTTKVFPNPSKPNSHQSHHNHRLVPGRKPFTKDPTEKYRNYNRPRRTYHEPRKPRNVENSKYPPWNNQPKPNKHRTNFNSNNPPKHQNHSGINKKSNFSDVKTPPGFKPIKVGPPPGFKALEK
ncbi:E3 ubiquitin-protein ligase RNF25-like [Ciona intestinalis]